MNINEPHSYLLPPIQELFSIKNTTADNKQNTSLNVPVLSFFLDTVQEVTLPHLENVCQQNNIPHESTMRRGEGRGGEERRREERRKAGRGGEERRRRF